MVGNWQTIHLLCVYVLTQVENRSKLGRRERDTCAPVRVDLVSGTALRSGCLFYKVLRAGMRTKRFQAIFGGYEGHDKISQPTAGVFRPRVLSKLLVTYRFCLFFLRNPTT